MKSPGFESISRIALAIFALLASACGEPPVVHPGYNVIFIVADTLRADHLGSYGYERDTSPFLDELARSNIRFANARAQASCTFPSVNSMLTSRNVFLFHDSETRPGIPEGIPSLAEILKEHGYTTAAYSASPIMRKTKSDHNPVGGFGRGFDVFDERCLWYQSTCISHHALRGIDQLEEITEPFLLYLHYMDPHDPYIAIKEHRGRFAKSYEGEHDFIAAGDPNPIDGMIRRGEVEENLAPEDFRHLIDLYDEDIYSLDFGLRQLFEGLEERQLLERSLVVIASDHGEAFYEHGEIKHCFTVYDNETRVPLVFLLPKVAGSVEVGGWAQNLDIVPTLLDYLGMEAEPYGLEGETLRPLIESKNGDSNGRLAYSAMGAYRSVNDERFKMVLDFGRRQAGLYDLVEDPGETRDLSEEHPEVRNRLLRELNAWTDKVEAGTEEERLDRARELEDMLRALGYFGDG